ncbi:DUF1642 domain-containing protein, partial [Streptococcus oralis]|uniref:DUF1642 domain-containing protein n=1 Tax=Streptococcus oralis TaxID=1303 RepID=UPI000ADBA819
HAKWREGYEQGKFEGMVGREKVTVPQFVADFITEQKKLGYTLSYSIDASMSDRVAEWYLDNSEVFALAWILSYEIEKEKRYIVRIKGVEEDNAFLNYYAPRNEWFMDSGCDMKDIRAFHTRKELEEADFGWVFDCEGVEIEEV